MAYGLVLGENEATKAVKDLYKTNGQSTWDQAYQNAQNWRTSELTGIAEQERAGIKLYGESEAREIADVKYDYNQALRDAYAATTKNDAAIMKSNLGQGYKDLYIGENQAALQEAYDSYRKSYLQQKSQIESQTQYGVESILQQGEKAATTVEKTYQEQLDYLNESLAAEGKNVSDLTNLTFDYLQHLHDEYPDLFKEFDWSKYEQYFDKETGKLNITDLMESFTNWKTDEKGIYQAEFNKKAIDFFDQILSYKGSGITVGNQEIKIPEFGAYLSGKNSDLLNWLNSYNQWYTSMDKTTGEQTYKTGYEIFKEMVGLDPNDNLYSFAERFGGLTEKELNDAFTNWYSDAMTRLSDSKKDSRAADAQLTDSLIKDLKSFVKDTLKINDEEIDDLFTALEKYSSDITNAIKTDGQLAEDWFTMFGKDLVTGGAIGAVTYPLTGWTGLAAGGIAGAIAGIIEASVSTDKNVKDQENLLANVQQAYSDALTAIIGYAQMKRRISQGEEVEQTGVDFDITKYTTAEELAAARKAHDDAVTKALSTTVNDITWNNTDEYFNSLSDKSKLTENQYKAMLIGFGGNDKDAGFQKFKQLFPTYSAYSSAYDSWKTKKDAKDKEDPYAGKYEGFNIVTKDYREDLIKNGYLPTSDDGFWKPDKKVKFKSSTISDIEYDVKDDRHWTAGDNIVIDGEEVELNLETKHANMRGYVSSFMPKNSLFACEYQGEKYLFYKTGKGQIFKLSTIEKDDKNRIIKKGYNKEHNQSMWDALWNRAYEQQQKYMK